MLQDLRKDAEIDLVHAHVNQIAFHLGLPLLDLSSDVTWVIEERIERLAHFGGVDELRVGLGGGATSTGFWDHVALGHQWALGNDETDLEEK